MVGAISEFRSQLLALIASEGIYSITKHERLKSYLSIRVSPLTSELSNAILTIDSSTSTRKTPGYGIPPNRQVLYCWRLLWLSTRVIEKIVGLFALSAGLVLFG